MFLPTVHLYHFTGKVWTRQTTKIGYIPLNCRKMLSCMWMPRMTFTFGETGPLAFCQEKGPSHKLIPNTCHWQVFCWQVFRVSHCCCPSSRNCCFFVAEFTVFIYLLISSKQECYLIFAVPNLHICLTSGTMNGSTEALVMVYKAKTYA